MKFLDYVVIGLFGFWVAVFALAIILFLGDASSKADLLTLDTGSIEAVQYLPGSQDPALDRMGQSYNINVDFKLPGVFYWDNSVLSWTDSTKFVEIGYKFELGAKVTPRFQVYLNHESDHALDYSWPWSYPQYFGVGLRYTFYSQEKK